VLARRVGVKLICQILFKKLSLLYLDLPTSHAKLACNFSAHKVED
jgi:hypothetical protein